LWQALHDTGWGFDTGWCFGSIKEATLWQALYDNGWYFDRQKTKIGATSSVDRDCHKLKKRRRKKNALGNGMDSQRMELPAGSISGAYIYNQQGILKQNCAFQVFISWRCLKHVLRRLDPFYKKVFSVTLSLVECIHKAFLLNHFSPKHHCWLMLKHCSGTETQFCNHILSVNTMHLSKE